jgi:hypothetical protein
MWWVHFVLFFAFFSSSSCNLASDFRYTVQILLHYFPDFRHSFRGLWLTSLKKWHSVKWDFQIVFLHSVVLEKYMREVILARLQYENVANTYQHMCNKFFITKISHPESHDNEECKNEIVNHTRDGSPRCIYDDIKIWSCTRPKKQKRRLIFPYIVILLYSRFIEYFFRALW